MFRKTVINPVAVSTGLLILRLGIGFSYIYNRGYLKITHPELWPKLGANMAEIGIHFAPVFWGFLAAFSESFGAALLAIGFATRISAFLLAFTMFIAFLTGFSEEFNSHAFEMMIVFISIVIIGPGKFSVDAAIWK